VRSPTAGSLRARGPMGVAVLNGKVYAAGGLTAATSRL
jgi:hypothetical protein